MLQDSNVSVQESTISQEAVFSDEDDEDWYDHPDMSADPGPVRPGENTQGYMDMAKRPLPPIPPDEEPSVQQPPQPQQPPRVSDSPRMAHRPLPAAPGPTPPKGELVPPARKKAGVVKNNDTPAAPRISPKPKEPTNTQDSSPKPALPGIVGGDQDLAAVLRAKFAARSGAGADSGNSSEEDSVKPSKQLPAKPKPQPMVPKKPSEIKKDSEEPQKGFTEEPKEGKSFSRPPPPVKNKPLKPNAITSKPKGNIMPPDVSAKPSFAGVQLKPVSKQGPRENSDAGKPSNGPRVPLKSNGTAEANSGYQTPRPLVNKPLVPGKPKPATATKPNIASKPSVAAQKPKQNVSSLANNLSGKLNFGSVQADCAPKETAVKPPVLQNKPSSQSAASGAPMSRSYVALYDFTAENEGEIGFNEGDDVEVLEEQGDWSLVRIWDEEGWAPTNYFEKV